MIKHKSAFLSGVSIYICFCILVASDSISNVFKTGSFAINILFSEILAFILPTIFMIALIRGNNKIRIPASTKQFKPKNIRFAIYLGIITCLISFLLNIFFLNLGNQDVSGVNPLGIDGRDIQRNFVLYLIGLVIIPAFTKEIYFRGVLFTVFSRYAGTKIAIILSALVFAMLYLSFYTFAGAFILGLVLAWLTYIFKSIWYSVITHSVNTLCYLFMIWITDTYSAFGIWKYIIPVCLFILLLFIYMALVSTEKLLLSGRVPHFKPCTRPAKQAVCILTLNLGAIIFIISFFAKTVFKVI